MKLRTLFTSLLLLIVGAMSAAITSGYYRVVSYNGKYLTENTSSHKLVCSEKAESNYAQVWYLTVSGTSVTFKNVLTDYGIVSFGDISTEDPNYTSPTRFYPTETGSVFVFADSEGGSVGLHCDNYNNVVRWGTSDNKSKWTIEAAEVDASALAAQKATIAEATNSQLTQFFTSTACTELNSNYVLMSDANLRSAMSALPTTVQDMAVKVKNNDWTTYSGWDKTDMNFRIGTYNAYSKHDRWNNIIGTGYVFGRLTNPTGISVTAGEYLQVYVGAIPSGQNVKLEVAGLYQPTGTTYPLKQGMNVLLMASSGNCFVNYEVDNTTSGKTPYTALSSYAPVTVHFEGGTVNGYFDLTKNYTNSDWEKLQTNLLKGSTVELKTNNLVFHLTTDLVKEACPTNMVELLGEWDKILDMEHSLMGLDEFNGYWNNTLSVTDITGDSYMYATNYGTYYHVGTVPSVMSYDDLFAGGALWGPAHENGHVFQKYINMVGQTEVSNNLFSNVAIYNNGHLTSRAANISTTFENMRSNVFWNDRGIWERTHLYFQLYQFFHILGKKSNFYPELFKAFRADPMVHTGGIFISAKDDYLKFYKKCCQVSGYDLTEFFQAYGFFVIPAQPSYTLDEGTKNAYHVGDYGDYYLTVTQEDINNVKAEVAAMNLPKANIIFIEDRITAPYATYDGAPAGAKKTAFSNESDNLIGQSGETGQYTTFGATCSAYTYSVNDNQVSMSGSGAVGFKVYDSTGKLFGLYNTYNFTLPSGIGTGYTIKAAGGNGTDVTATYDEPAAKVESDVTDTKNATTPVTAGAQITSEDQLEYDVDGGLYLVYYVGNDNTMSAYMKDTGSSYTGKQDFTPTQNAVYRFIYYGGGHWNVQNYVTGKFWGTPTANSNTYIGSDEIGVWMLNFQTNGNAAPVSADLQFSWNRSGSNIHPWSAGTANVNQFRIEKVTPSTELDDFTNKNITVSSEAEATLQTGKWYVMFDRGTNHGYLYENGENKLYNTATAPSGSATDNAKYLVRIVGWENEYYIQTGLGNFFGNIQQSTPVPTTSTPTEQITLKKINGTDGHYYLQSAAGIVLDANSLEQGDATVVGWGSTAPTSINGNNDWAFYPVEFVDAPAPSTGYDYYTINNTNSGRGALMYAPAVGGNKWVWSSGKNGAASFDANDAKFHWVLCPTGTENQYYLYNVAAQKFIVPLTGGSSYTSNSGTAYSWAFSNNAVAVTLISQSNGTYKIKTVTTDTYVSVSPSLTCPIINYNDAGSEFTITKIGSANSEVNEQVTSALGKLADNTTPLSAVPSAGTDGWYIIRIKQHGTYADKYVYHPASEINYSSTYYPLSFDHDVNLRPAIDDANYYTRISNESGTVYWQLPNGKYLYGANSKFPVSTETKSSFSMDYSANGFRMWGASRYAVPYLLGGQYFIGETSNGGNAYYDIYPVDLASAGLTPWQVTIENGLGSVLMTCNRNDVVGGTSVYNNGFFFLPSGVTPTSGDFSMIGMLGCTINADNHTITAQYNPELSITSAEITVGPGNQTAGKGNEMQALLRIKATPFSDFKPTQFIVNLTGAANVDNVKVYYTLNDEIRSATASPVLLGTASATEGEVTINTASAPSVAAKSSVYYWVTADVKSNATEWETIDASLLSISYTNAYKQDNSLEATTVDLTEKGNPAGEMRIFKTQNYLWTASNINTQYYRIPTIINTADGGILALTDDRYSNTSDLGNHKIDVVARKSMDGGLTWSEPVTVAAGDGSTEAAYGYGDAAVVRTKSGKLICLMAAGRNGFGSGMLNMGYSESTDNGATWSAVKDIYSSINKNGAEITSAFTTAGKGVTFSNGRVAFAMNGKVSGTIHEFVLYSDDEGATWALSPSVYSGADESKLEIMNDNSLLVSVRRGYYNSMSNRGYNRTTGDASGDGINSWNEQGIWGNEMNANGCNADILYYSRATEGGRDVLLHTLTKNRSDYREDLRLYASFDQGETWKEVFQIQPGYAAYSSMQKLANGDLAIIFEDGSIGNQDKLDCYAINYVVLSAETVKAKIEELYAAAHYPVATIISQGETNGSAPWGTWSPSGWADTFTTNASSGVAGVVVSADGTLFNRETDYGQRVFCLKPSAAGATDVITITPPAGYIIKGYSIGGHFWTSGEKYTLTSADGKQSAEVNTNSGMPNMLTVDNIYAPSTTFSIKSKGSTNNKFACITQFTVTLADIYPLSLNAVGDASYATLYLPFDVELPTGTDAFAVEIAGSYAQLNKIDGGLPTGTPAVIVNNNGDTKATLTLANGLSAYSGTNALKGTYVDMTLDLAADNSYYSLGRQKDDNDDYVIGFYKYKNGDKTSITLKANRAYLDTSANGGEVNGVKGFRLSWGDTDAIAPVVDGTPSDGIYYDLSGRRVSKPTLGMYIINGRKVMVR